MGNKIKNLFNLLKRSAQGMSEDNVPMMGAALAYYTAFSLAPLLVIAIAITGVVFGDNGNARIFDIMRGIFGNNGVSAIQSMVNSAAKAPGSGIFAAGIGIATILIGASGVFQQLQYSLNTIWKVTPRPDAGLWVLVRQRLLSFGMVVVIAFILLVSLLISTAIAVIGKVLAGYIPGGEATWHFLDFVFSLAVVSVLFALIYKVLCDVRLSWREVAMGGLFTGIFFDLGKLALALYLGKGGTASTYGAAGSVIAILLWVYYASQVFLFGAEFTRAYVVREGRLVMPKEEAQAQVAISPLNAAALAQKVRKGEFTINPLSSAMTPGYGISATAIAAGAIFVGRAGKVSGRSAARRYILGGISIGLGLGTLALLELARRRAASPGNANEGDSTLTKAFAKLPKKVKIAAIIGATMWGGREAYKEAKTKIRETV